MMLCEDGGERGEGGLRAAFARLAVCGGGEKVAENTSAIVV